MTDMSRSLAASGIDYQITLAESQPAVDGDGQNGFGVDTWARDGSDRRAIVRPIP